jgi:hypothetical protein
LVIYHNDDDDDEQSLIRGRPALRALRTFFFFNRPRLRSRSTEASRARAPGGTTPIIPGVVLVRTRRLAAV